MLYEFPEREQAIAAPRKCCLIKTGPRMNWASSSFCVFLTPLSIFLKLWERERLSLQSLATFMADQVADMAHSLGYLN